MFKEEREEQTFQWSQLGNVEEGRPNLGDTTSARVYRLMQYTLRDVMIRRFGVETASLIFYEAGHKAGQEFCRNVLDTELPFEGFIAQFQQQLKELGIGIMRVEKVDLEELSMILSVYEDLDCSGLPVSNEMICDYDEGFLAGVMETYTGKALQAREVDCWAMGERVCRFEIGQTQEP